MSLHYVYSLPSNATLDITQYCRLYQFSCSQDAKEGSVAHTTLVVDDEAGALDFIGHRRIYMYEDLAAASNQVIYNGYIQREVVSRGPYRTGAGRIWTLDLADTNVLLNRRLMNGTDASRPAEDDIDRIVALETMTELNTFDDFLYVNLTAATTPMDAVDYRTQPALQYIDDCAQASGKNYFGWYRESTGDNSLWYDFAASSNWQGTKRLSNVLADVDNSTTFAVDMEHDAELDRDPSRVASGVMLPFDGVAVGSNTINGTVYVQNPTTTATFAAIDWLAPSVNVKTKAKALSRANRYLADASQEDDLIHCSVKLPSANVNDFMAGMAFDAKFSHLPRYEAFTTFRCLSRTVTEISEDPTRAYRLDLELSVSTTPGCSFVQYTGLAGSSEDIFGAFLGTTGNFNPGAPYAYTYQQPSSPAPGLYGVPNNGSNWGELSGVFAPMVISAWFEWDLDDLGTPAICTVMMRSSDHGEQYQTLEASNDELSWDTIVDYGWSSTVPYSTTAPFWTYRYWRLRINDPHPGGYNIGVDNEFLMLFAAE